MERQVLLDALEAQGARCGHMEGKSARGAYVLGMEALYSREAALANTAGRRLEWASEECVSAWQAGYEAGFRVGADGMELDAETRNHALPEEV